MGMPEERQATARIGPLALCEPDDKHGSEVADRSVMTSADDRSDLD